MDEQFSIDYVELPGGRTPARDFIDAQDNATAAKIDATIDRLGMYGNRMPHKMVEKLTDDVFELKVHHFGNIFRVLFFYQPGKLIIITSGFQKKTPRTPPREIRGAERLRRLWVKYRNEYPASQQDRDRILREAEL